ncbi:YciI family protein [Actinoplanes sp. URMC 104]|uniref:YciI family protein n=1 Tax=Actinoplanes sp. URMC 104 TaxID=3423409 RepID=UPI003F1A0E7B
MISKYLAPIEQVDEARDAHLAYLDGLEAQGLVVTAGRQNAPTGGVVLLNVDDEARARELIAQDPYVLRGVAEYSAIGWTPSRGALKDYPKP